MAKTEKIEKTTGNVKLTAVQMAEKALSSAKEAAKALQDAGMPELAEKALSEAKANMDKAKAMEQEVQAKEKAMEAVSILEQKAIELEKSAPEAAALLRQAAKAKASTVNGLLAFASIHNEWKYGKGDAQAFNQAMLAALQNNKPFTWQDAEAFRHGTAINSHVQAVNMRLRKAKYPFKLALSAHKPLRVVSA